MSGDRILGAVAAVIAVAIGLEALTFRVGFYSDPLGAGGLPLIAAVLGGSGGLILMLRPGSQAEPVVRLTIIRALATSASLLIYAAALPVLGFIVATTSVLTALCAIFDGPLRKAVILSAAYTVGLYILFYYVLSLPLPVGSLFVRGA